MGCRGLGTFWGRGTLEGSWKFGELLGIFWERDKDGAPLGVHRGLGTFWGWGTPGCAQEFGDLLGTFWGQGTPGGGAQQFGDLLGMW